MQLGKARRSRAKYGVLRCTAFALVALALPAPSAQAGPPVRGKTYVGKSVPVSASGVDRVTLSVSRGGTVSFLASTPPSLGGCGATRFGIFFVGNIRASSTGRFSRTAFVPEGPGPTTYGGEELHVSGAFSSSGRSVTGTFHSVRRAGSAPRCETVRAQFTARLSNKPAPPTGGRSRGRPRRCGTPILASGRSLSCPFRSHARELLATSTCSAWLSLHCCSISRPLPAPPRWEAGGLGPPPRARRSCSESLATVAALSRERGSTSPARALRAPRRGRSRCLGRTPDSETASASPGTAASRAP